VCGHLLQENLTFVEKLIETNQAATWENPNRLLEFRKAVYKQEIGIWQDVMFCLLDDLS
jgi:hypothetical protein